MCEFEDSQNCIWLANHPNTTNGTGGTGESFIDVLGHTLYAEHIVALAVLLFIVWSLVVIAADMLAD